MKKREYKYLVPVEFIDDVRNEMKHYVTSDKNSETRKEKEYTVRSVYYDNKKFDCYYEKVEGLQTKKKIRIRGYNSYKKDDILFFEVKRKFENYIQKSRAPLKWEEAENLFSNYSNSKIPFETNTQEYKEIGHFLYNYHVKKLMPTILIIYEREAFFSKFDKFLRITFDKNLRSLLYPSLDSLYLNGNVKYVLPGYFILEIKFYRGLPLWLKSIIVRYRMQRMSISKYSICMGSHVSMKKKFVTQYLGR